VRNANEPDFLPWKHCSAAEAGSSVRHNCCPRLGPAKTLVLLFDTSLSMQWEKLERSYQALETLLRTLRPSDSFNLILFNQQTQVFSPLPCPQITRLFSAHWICPRQPAARRHRCGNACWTKIEAMRRKRKWQPLSCSAQRRRRHPRAYSNGKIAAWYEAVWNKLPESQRPKNLCVWRWRRCESSATAFARAGRWSD